MSDNIDRFRKLLAGSRTRVTVTGVGIGAALGASGAELANVVFENKPHTPPELFASLGGLVLGGVYNQLFKNERSE